MFLLNLKPVCRLLHVMMMQMISINVHCLSCILQADPKGPSFQTVFFNTEQMLKVDTGLIAIGRQFLFVFSKFLIGMKKYSFFHFLDVKEKVFLFIPFLCSNSSLYP